MATEKTWAVEGVTTVATSSDYGVHCRAIMMFLKNQMVAKAGWTVIASCDGTDTYEWEGITSGGSYGGQSTGLYDVWDDPSEIRRAPDGSGPAWMVLRSPTGDYGPFYMVIAYESSNDLFSDWYVTNREPVPHASPINYKPTLQAGDRRIVFDTVQCYVMYSGTQSTEVVFSGCADGSFYLFGSLVIRSYPTTAIIFTLLEEFPEAMEEMPVLFGVYGEDTNSFDYQDGLAFLCGCHGQLRQGNRSDHRDWQRVEPGSSFWLPCYFVVLFPQYSTATQPFVTMSGVDFEGKVNLTPAYAVGLDFITFYADGAQTFVRIPDVWVGPSGMAYGSNIPSTPPYDYFSIGSFWFPGNISPTWT